MLILFYVFGMFFDELSQIYHDDFEFEFSAIVKTKSDGLRDLDIIVTIDLFFNVGPQVKPKFRE